LLGIVDPKALFTHYLYVSGTSPVFVEHLRSYAEEVLERFEVPGGSLVVEIGSNDGTLLGELQRRGLRVLGVDPARNIVEESTERGIPAMADFFTASLARGIREDHGRAAIIVANNVLAHIDELGDVMEGIRRLLLPNGVLVFEVGYLLDVVSGTLFDTIYHEHVSYHTVRPLLGFLERHGLELFDVARNDSQGGSIRCYVQLRGGPNVRTPAVSDLCALEEQILGLNPLKRVRAMGDQIERVRSDLTTLLSEIQARGQRIAGYGAPAKATTLMYYFGLTRDVLEFIVDDNPLKQGRFTPGLHVPIVSAERLVDGPPDYLLLLAWNFADSIIERNRNFTDAGGKFIVPLPELKIR
jgi:SAM-dependent methyltransferase